MGWDMRGGRWRISPSHGLPPEVGRDLWARRRPARLPQESSCLLERRAGQRLQRGAPGGTHNDETDAPPPWHASMPGPAPCAKEDGSRFPSHALPADRPGTSGPTSLAAGVARRWFPCRRAYDTDRRPYDTRGD